MRKFREFAAITASAVLSYRTPSAVRRAQTQLKKRYRAEGSYGCDRGLLDHALHMCEVRLDDFRAVQNGWIPQVPDESRPLY